MALGHRLLLTLSLTTLLFAADAPTFEKTVQPVLNSTCSPCHNDQLASGGLNIAAFAKPGSIVESREGWERILEKLRAGEMPPKGIPRPPQLDAVIQYLQGEFVWLPVLASPRPKLTFGFCLHARGPRTDSSRTLP